MRMRTLPNTSSSSVSSAASDSIAGVEAKCWCLRFRWAPPHTYTALHARQHSGSVKVIATAIATAIVIASVEVGSAGW